MLALAHPGTEVVGISAVHGNVDVQRVGSNIARVLTLCGCRDVPFYLGADEPLVAAAMDASFVSGAGMGVWLLEVRPDLAAHSCAKHGIHWQTW
jgi:pyrimidine-specific ribonucleoside hydrolase